MEKIVHLCGCIYDEAPSLFVLAGSSFEAQRAYFWLLFILLLALSETIQYATILVNIIVFSPSVTKNTVLSISHVFKPFESKHLELNQLFYSHLCTRHETTDLSLFASFQCLD